jgi:DUF1009 family protein
MPGTPVTAPSPARWGLIAGNGRFPFLVLEAARSQGIEMAVIALREEAAPELEQMAARLHWVSLGELSRALELLHREGVTRAVMAGQVKHNKIFSAIRPDWKLAKLLLSLPRKNTDALIGAVARLLESEGIELVDSTAFLKPLVPEPGVLTRRAPDARESADIGYGREIAHQLAALDLGQAVVVSDRACVAIEAMEGTDETIERAAHLAGGKPLVVVKVAKPRQDMRFDVPVVGLRTIEVMQRAGVTALAIDAGRILLFDRPKLLEAAPPAPSKRSHRTQRTAMRRPPGPAAHERAAAARGRGGRGRFRPQSCARVSPARRRRAGGSSGRRPGARAARRRRVLDVRAAGCRIAAGKSGCRQRRRAHHPSRTGRLPAAGAGY